MKRNQKKGKKTRAIRVHETYDPWKGPFDFSRTQPVMKKHMRLINAGGSQSITLTVNDLANLLIGVVATTAILGYYESTSLRIKRVRIWACSTSGAATTVTASYATYAQGASQPMFGGPPNAKTSTTSSVAKYAYVDLRPNKETSWQGSWWSIVASNAATILNLVIPDESVIHIDYETFQDALGTRIVSPLAIAGASAGTWYSSYGTTGLVAQGVNTI